MASNVETLIRGAVVKTIGKVADFNRRRLPRPTDAHPFLTGIHKPMTEELTIEALRVDGEIPAALTGRFPLTRLIPPATLEGGDVLIGELPEVVVRAVLEVEFYFGHADAGGGL